MGDYLLYGEIERLLKLWLGRSDSQPNLGGFSRAYGLRIRLPSALIHLTAQRHF